MTKRFIKLKALRLRSITTVLMTLNIALILSACSESSTNSVQASQAEALTATATLISQDSVTLSPPAVTTMWQYKVQFLAKENQPVKEGDVVIRFDSQQLKNDLISRQSELNAALKEKEQEGLMQEQQEQDLLLSLAETKKDVDKEKRKADIVDASISGIEKAKQEKQYKIAQLSYEQAKQRLANFYESQAVNGVVTDATINRLKSEVTRIKNDIGRLTVKAPKAGIVMYKAGRDGEKPAVGDSVWQGQSLITIPSLDNVSIQAQFDEPDMTKVSIGRPVKVTLDAYPEQPYSGRVVALGQSFKNKSKQNQRIVFDAFIQLDKVETSVMRPGMQGKVELLAISTYQPQEARLRAQDGGLN